MPDLEHHASMDAHQASLALDAFADGIRHRRPDLPETRTLTSELLSQVRSLRQVLDRLAAIQLEERVRARDQAGQIAPGIKSATETAMQLRHAASALGRVELGIDVAAGLAQETVWAPADAAGWIHVLTVRGDAADAVDDALDNDEAASALDRLVAFDRGEETTMKALEAGDCYEQLPAGPIDRTHTNGGYALVSRPLRGDVMLLRALHRPGRSARAETDALSAARRSHPHVGTDSAPPAHPAGHTVRRSPGLAL